MEALKSGEGDGGEKWKKKKKKYEDVLVKEKWWDKKEGKRRSMYKSELCAR